MYGKLKDQNETDSLNLNGSAPVCFRGPTVQTGASWCGVSTPGAPAERISNGAQTAQEIRLIHLSDTWEMVQRSYAFRRCFVCNELGRCGHREPEVEIAHMEAIANRENRRRNRK